MSKVYPKIAKQVLTDKIDRRQGSEWDIVVVDLTRSHGAGFMKEKRRLNVLFSRAKNGLYIVGHKQDIDDLKRSDGKFLRDFQSVFLSNCRHLEVSDACNWYQPGQVDVTQEADAELEPADN